MKKMNLSQSTLVYIDNEFLSYDQQQTVNRLNEVLQYSANIVVSNLHH